MITPLALPGHPFGKVDATGFPGKEHADTNGIPYSEGCTRAYGPDRRKNFQVRAVRGTAAEKGAHSE